MIVTYALIFAFACFGFGLLSSCPKASSNACGRSNETFGRALIAAALFAVDPLSELLIPNDASSSFACDMNVKAA